MGGAALSFPGCGDSEGDGPPRDRAGAGPTEEIERGERLVDERGCLACHSTDGSPGAGPTWKGLAASEVKLADGRIVLADREYLIRSILDADAETVAGFTRGLMAGAIRPGSLTQDQAAAIVSYLETL